MAPPVLGPTGQTAPVQYPAGGKAASAPQAGKQLRRPRQSAQHGGSSRGSYGDSRAHLMGFKPYHAVNVPKHVNMQVVATHSNDQPKTTAMLRNIPNRYTQPTLLDEIDKLGFAGSYDFFYLPMDTHNRTNVGYAFINFVSQEEMERFTQAFSGSNFKDHASQKVARVSPAHIQGFYANVQHFWDRAVTHSRNSQYRPIVVINGQRKDLSEAYNDLFCQPYYYEGDEMCGEVEDQFANVAWGQELDLAPPPGLEPEPENLLPSFLRNSEEETAYGYGLCDQGDWSVCSPMWDPSTGYWPADVYGAAGGYGWPEVSEEVPLPTGEEELLNQEASEDPATLDPAALLADDTLFESAKRDIQEAVSKWLEKDKEKAKPDAAHAHATSSTEGGSRTHSRSSSLRSGTDDGRGPSPEDPQYIRCSSAAEPAALKGLTPRKDRTPSSSAYLNRGTVVEK